MGKDSMSLGDRMKRYEECSNIKLTRRMPVVLRFDGCSFHSFTKKFKRPFDDIMIKTMQETLKSLCENIQGCVFGYTQSDEITLVLIDYKTLTSDAWFDYKVEKMCSIGASMCSRFFNEHYIRNVNEQEKNLSPDEFKIYASKFFKADFDCRAFNVPKEDVCNCILWRQQDATRNSILGLAQSLYPQKEICGVSCKALQDKMFTEKDVNWNDLSTPKKRGTSCLKNENGWYLDFDMPILSESHDYVDTCILL